MPLSNFKPEQYQQLLNEKAQSMHTRFDTLLDQHQQIPLPLDVFDSPIEGFRCRAEFRFWHSDDDSYYAMYKKGQNDQPIRIDHFPIAHPHIQQLMGIVREQVLNNDLLRQKLFQIEFLSTLSNQNLITLIYHKPLAEDWQAEAEALQARIFQHYQALHPNDENLCIKLIGRSKKQKITLIDDYVDECLQVDGQALHYRQIEGGFTQPNAFVNQSMLSWAKAQLSTLAEQDNNPAQDLLELYCGNGNFTVALAPLFKQVLATEISKSSVKAAHHNFAVNQVNNVKICRLASEEVTQALNGEREFRRLKEQAIDLNDYQFSTVFVDPPRAGLDPGTLKLVSQFQQILYISCNPDTLLDNLDTLLETHEVISTAIFDQFPYTHHIESGVLLRKKQA